MKTLFLSAFLSFVTISVIAAKVSSDIEYIDSDPSTGTSEAVIVRNRALIHTTQLLPVNKKGEVVGRGDVAKQADQVFGNLSDALEGSSKDFSGLVKLNVYIAKAELAEKVREAVSRKFSVPKGHRKFPYRVGKANPAVTYVVGDLPHPEALVAMDAIAAGNVSHGAVTQWGKGNFARAALLPATGVVYVSGQADKGELPEATRGTLAKLKTTLDFLGLKKEDVVQCKAFMQPMSGVEAVKKEFEKFFEGQTVPPLVFVDWISKEYPIEIETIVASRPVTKDAPQIEFLTPPGVAPSPVYAKVVRVNRGDLLFVSGLCGKSSGQAQAEVTEIYESLGEILKKSGSDLTHLAKATYYVSNNETSGKLNELRPKYYDPKRPPAASKAMVKNVGFAGKGIAVDMIGVVTEK